jgi:hypothetical protein
VIASLELKKPAIPWHYNARPLPGSRRQSSAVMVDDIELRRARQIVHSDPENMGGESP